MQRISAFLLVLLVMTLAACQPMAIDRKQAPVTAESLISEAETAGDLQTAADDYLAKAADSEGPLQSAYFIVLPPSSTNSKITRKRSKCWRSSTPTN